MITSQSIFMTSSLVPQNNPSKPNVSNSPFSARSNHVNIKWPVIGLTMYCASQLGSKLLHVVRAKQAPTTAIPRDPEQENQDDKRINTEKSNAGGGPNLPIFCSLAKWLLGSFLVFFPFYKNLLRIEDKIEKTAITLLNAVESGAETVDKMAENAQRSLPENSNVMKVLKTVEKFAENVYNGAEVAESVVEKILKQIRRSRSSLDSKIDPMSIRPTLFSYIVVLEYNYFDNAVDKFDEMVEPYV